MLREPAIRGMFRRRSADLDQTTLAQIRPLFRPDSGLIRTCLGPTFGKSKGHLSCADVGSTWWIPADLRPNTARNSALGATSGFRAPAALAQCAGGGFKDTWTCNVKQLLRHRPLCRCPRPRGRRSHKMWRPEAPNRGLWQPDRRNVCFRGSLATPPSIPRPAPPPPPFGRPPEENPPRRFLNGPNPSQSFGRKW